MLQVHIKRGKQNKYFQRGMTLIEVIIALAIMGIIAMGFLTSFANQISILSMGKNITTKTFENQGEVEKSLEDIRKNKDFIDKSKWTLIAAKYNSDNSDRKDSTIKEGKVGNEVDLYKMQLKDRNNKTTKVFLSSSLASDLNYIKTLTVDFSKITINDDDKVKVAKLSDKSLPSVKGEFSIIGTNYYATVYKWYVSQPGIEDPFWPSDYQLVNRAVTEEGYTPKTAKINLTNLEKYANRYIVFTVQPADGNGIRFAEIASDKVLILGDEWRNGNFPWVDKDLNNKFDGYDVDKDGKLKYSDLLSGIDFNNFKLTPADDKIMDLSGGALYIPRNMEFGVEVTEGDSNEKKYEKDISFDSGTIDWFIEKGIYFSSIIDSKINEVRMKTYNGPIILYRFVELDNKGDAVLQGELSKLKYQTDFDFFNNKFKYIPAMYTDMAAEINSNSNINLTALGVEEGYINIQPYASVNGANVLLEAENYINFINSSVTLKSFLGDDKTLTRRIKFFSVKNINISSIDGYPRNFIQGNWNTNSIVDIQSNKNTFIDNAYFKDIEIYLWGDTQVSDIEWNKDYTLNIKDNKILKFKKGKNVKVQNNGELDLGKTALLQLEGLTPADFKRPLEIKYVSSSNTALLFTENYKRDISYASDISSISISAEYKDIGSGDANFELKTNVPSDNLRYSFDGNNILTFSASAESAGEKIINVTVRDKYAPSIQKEIKVKVTGIKTGESIATTVEVLQ